jgi:hypothetical protein
MYFTFTYVGPQEVTSRPRNLKLEKFAVAHRPPRIRFMISIAISFLNA